VILKNKLDRINVLVLLGCLIAHGGLLILLLIVVVQPGSSGRINVLQITSYLSLQSDTTPQMSKAKSDIVIEPPLELPPPPPLELDLPVIPEQQESALQPAQVSTADAQSTATSNSGSDDPNAGAAMRVYRDIAINTVSPISPPKLNEILWQSVIAALKKSKPLAHGLSLRVLIDTQGNIIDCQVIGGDAPPSLHTKACALLRGKTLFSFETPSPESQWHSLPEIIF
jgi:hypothetical protein